MAEKLYVATRKGLFTVIKNGAWKISKVGFLGDNCSAVLSSNGGEHLYVALDHGHFGVKLHRSGDGGKTFEEIGVPVYPEKPEGEAPWLDMHGREVPHSLLLIWCLEADHSSRPDGVWCGTIPGGLFHSPDRGDTWHLAESLWSSPLRRRWFGGGMDYPGIHSVSVDPNDAERMHIAVSCGGVLESTDGGKTWDCIGEGWRSDYMPPDEAGDPAIQDVHRLQVSPADTRVMWAQHHNGIFHSTDGGRHWTELKDIKPSVFGFACVVHPKDPETAWFVPEIKDERRIPVDGKLVVNRTQDGGKTFETLHRGLPQEHAYDLVYRHGLDINVNGDVLAMGSTTGSLFISENGGDDWQCISAHLPPVYAVRFGGGA